MIKYLLLVCLMATPFAQQAQAVVTHYDLDGNLIEGDDISQQTADLDSMSSMMMNMQETDSLGMNDEATTNDQASIDSTSSQAQIIDSASNDSMNYESIDSMNIEQTQPAEVTEQVEQQIVDASQMTENDSMSPMLDNAENTEQNVQANNDSASSLTENTDNNSVDPNMESVNSMDSINSMPATQEEDPNMAIENMNSDISSDSLMASPDMEHGFIQSGVASDEHDQQNEHTGEENQEGQHHDGDNHDGEHQESVHDDVEHSEGHPQAGQLDANDSIMASENLDNGFVQSAITTEEKKEVSVEEQPIEQKETEKMEEHTEAEQKEEHPEVEQKEEHTEVEQKEVHTEVESKEEHKESEELQSSEPQTQLVQGNCIIIYSQCNFKGEALEACNSLSEIEEFKAEIKSIYIPTGLGLTVYDGENFSGKTHKFKSSQECLTTPLSFAQITNHTLKGQNLRNKK